ncbi:hypothetical protein [Methanobrevibacter filiformis]|uniref:Uncharacterized protein n=1 Tax=Methanobrevibacter filiformis TaxID=55758 RepID=A0A166FAA5_9EURY|nr:hypothetical protein [Methanobrevibacter filiformis]KZX17462.1 hypothetical protein MBFIL_01200 [Methanobrevibacter filiformis]
MNTTNNDFLFDLIKYKYNEENQRNFEIDTKNNSMIAFLGVMLTVQTTFGSFIENMTLLSKLVFILSLVFYLSALILLIHSYYFKTFKTVPNANILESYYNTFKNKDVILNELFGDFKRAIDFNREVIKVKVKFSKLGFYLLIFGGLLAVIFVVTYLIL